VLRQQLLCRKQFTTIASLTLWTRNIKPCSVARCRHADWGCVHIDTSARPSTRIRVRVNTSLHVLQWRPLTLMRVLYDYALPVNFTRTSSFCAGRVFIQPTWSENTKFIRAMTLGPWISRPSISCPSFSVNPHIWHHKSSYCWIVHNSACAISKVIDDVEEYRYFFRQSIHSIRFHWRLSIDTRWVMCLYEWPRTLHSCGWSLYEWQTTRKRKPGLGLVPVSMWTWPDISATDLCVLLLLLRRLCSSLQADASSQSRNFGRGEC